MTWENQGSYWHVDHVLPVSSFDFTNEKNNKICTYLKNLRPLEAKEILSKHNKIDMVLYVKHIKKADYFEKKKCFFNNATPSNCRNLLKSSSTTSFEKSFEGSQVMTDLNSKNDEEYVDNPQQVS